MHNKQRTDIFIPFGFSSFCIILLCTLPYGEKKYVEKRLMWHDIAEIASMNFTFLKFLDSEMKFIM